MGDRQATLEGTPCAVASELLGQSALSPAKYRCLTANLKVIPMNVILVFALSIVLTACGGGGSSSGPSQPPANVAPVANAGLAQTVTAGKSVNLDGSSSSDANGDALTFGWSLTTKPTGSTSALSSASSAKPTFTPDVEGTYVATLTVNDGKLSSAPATVTISVSAPPTSTANREIPSFLAGRPNEINDLQAIF